MAAGPAVSAVMFDLDGTLIDTLDDVTLAMNGALAHKGLPAMDREAVRGLLGKGGTALALAAVGHARAERHPALVGEIHALYLDIYQRNLVVHSRLYPGVETVLASLPARGIGVALCTNKLSALTMPLLRSLALDDAFDVIACGDTVARRKPAPDQLIYLLDHLGVQPSAALMVGDTVMDREAATAAGVPFVHALYGYGGAMPHCAARIRHLEDLADLVGAQAPLSDFHFCGGAA